MYPVIPAELTQNAIQLVVYFVTILGTMFGLMLVRPCVRSLGLADLKIAD